MEESRKARGRGWWAMAVALWAAWGAGAELRAEQLIVATYNLENYLATDRMVDGEYQRDFPKPEAAKTALRSVIRSLNADILAVQEIGSLAYLKELQRDLRNEGCDYPHLELLQAGDEDRHVALLSKRPFVHVGRHTDLTFSYFGARETVKRGMLEGRVNTSAGEVTVFVVHLKSRFTDHSKDPLSGLRRSGEAEAVRDRILQRFPSPMTDRFLLVGDFNDVPHSRPLRALTKKGKTELGVALPSSDSRGEAWTHCFRKEDSYSRVDYVIASMRLRSEVAEGRARIVDSPETREASDHRPVVVTLELKGP